MIGIGIKNPVPLIPTSCRSTPARTRRHELRRRPGFPDSANETATLQVSYVINGEPFTDTIVVPFAGDASLPVCGNPAKAPDEPSDPPPHDPPGPTP